MSRIRVGEEDSLLGEVFLKFFEMVAKGEQGAVWWRAHRLLSALNFPGGQEQGRSTRGDLEGSLSDTRCGGWAVEVASRPAALG